MTTTTNDDPKLDGPAALIADAMDFMRMSAAAFSEDRARGLSDFKFLAGEQWPTEIINSRRLESRPCLTINRTKSYHQQVINSIRQQRPRIKVHPVDDEATVEMADIINGMTRHIEESSNAGYAYDTAASCSTAAGIGYFRIVADYVDSESFDQELQFAAVDNPFSVYFDPNSTQPDGSDAEGVLICDKMSRALFRKFYPGQDDGQGFISGNADRNPDWLTADEIRVAEYYKVERSLETLLMLSNGKTAWERDLPKNYREMLAKSGFEVSSSRKSYRRKIMWYKLTSMEILEQREMPGKWIPIVPVYGNTMLVDGRRRHSGIVRDARDAQQMYNAERTAMIETINLAPKAKWLMVEGQDEGYEAEWQQANVSARPILHYKRTGLDGMPAEAPERLQPEPPAAGIMAAAGAIAEDLQSVLGIVDPAMRIKGNVSGKALQGERIQSDNSNFHYYDNLMHSIRHAGKILLDLIPHYYDTERVIRIIDPSGQPDTVKINEEEAETGKILNDVTVGQYDVVMDVGPGYATKRQEALDTFMNLMGTPLG